MTVLWIVLGVVAYLLIGLGFVYLLGIPVYSTAEYDEPEFAPLLCALFWPLVAPVVLLLAMLLWLSKLCNWVSNKGAKR